MKKTLQEIRAMVEREGLRLLGIKRGGSGHFRITVEATGGARLNLTAPCTPGDRRGELNRRAELRRFARMAQSPCMA